MKTLSDRALLTEMLRLYGGVKTARILGLCMLLALTGAATREDIVMSPVMSHATRYRLLSELRVLRAHLAALGYQLDDAEDPEVAMVQALGHARVTA